MVFSTRRSRAVSWQRRTHSTQVFPQMETGLLYRWHNWFGDTVYSSSSSVSYDRHYLLVMPVVILKAVIIMLNISRFLIELWCNLSIFEGWIGLKLKITGILGCFLLWFKDGQLTEPWGVVLWARLLWGFSRTRRGNSRGSSVGGSASRLPKLPTAAAASRRNGVCVDNAANKQTAPEPPEQAGHNPTKASQARWGNNSKINFCRK